jgi:hypothetical protein
MKTERTENDESAESESDQSIDEAEGTCKLNIFFLSHINFIYFLAYF